MNELVIGTSNFNQKYGLSNKSLKKEEIKKILYLAKRNKIKYLDTAIDYNLTKDFVKEISFKKFNIISKFKLPKKDKKKFVDNLESMIFEELDKFNVRNFHTILLHRPSDLNTIFGNKIIKTLNKLKRKNVLKNIGV